MENLPKNKKIILFDGVCNLCDSSVQFIIKHDKNDTFRFVALQSELGQKITKHIGVDTSKTDSIVLYEPKIAYYTKAQAALKIANELGGWISLLTVFTMLMAFFISLSMLSVLNSTYFPEVFLTQFKISITVGA